MNGPSPGARRLFFALWPDAPLRETLRAATRKLVRGCGGRPVRPDNLHLTLVFLGSTPAERFELVREVAARIDVERFALSLDAVDYFRRSGVLSLVPSAPPGGLFRLVAELERGLADTGFEIDPRPYRPHLTLARKVRRPPGGVEPRQPVLWSAASFALIESITDRQGPHYSVLERWPLSGAEPGSPAEPPTP